MAVRKKIIAQNSQIKSKYEIFHSKQIYIKDDFITFFGYDGNWKEKKTAYGYTGIPLTGFSFVNIDEEHKEW